ncbi:MAG: hypothetical protein E4H14_10165 [Candidatus Thorarchaeota archaeon]|nr:MAG: hypothetical protein E4H14_10165 [Candidatus Thorarchaeota archaeon]
MIKMIIAVSDLHLRDPASNKKGFISFIEEFLKPNCNEMTDLVLLGDILDLWRRNSALVILENLDILNNVCDLGFHVHYIIGNHDFIMKDYSLGRDDRKIPVGLTCDPENVTFGDVQVLYNDGKKFRFIHGHQMDYWYTLPFYEAFARAMCDVTKEVEELSSVWKVLHRQEEGFSSFISKRIQEFSDEWRAQIDRKLAGPLVGHSGTVEESRIEEYNLLGHMIEFKGFPYNSLKALREEIHALSLESKNFPMIPGLKDMGTLTHNNQFEELATSFLIVWKEVFQWMSINKDSRNQDLMKLVRKLQRVAAIFSSDLHQDEFLIHGHGHNGHVDYANSMADSGCWIEDKASFIKIDDGKVSCTPWPIR